jgi:SNF2 family DNA or RNA helicase
LKSFSPLPLRKKKEKKNQKMLQEANSVCRDDKVDDEKHVWVGGLRLERIVFDKLYPHQREGVAWLWKVHSELGGGVLGDDMGLGTPYNPKLATIEWRHTANFAHDKIK